MTLAELQKALDEALARETTLKADLATANTKITGLETAALSHKTEIEAEQAKVTDLQGKLTKAEGEVTRLTTENTDLKAKEQDIETRASKRVAAICASQGIDPVASTPPNKDNATEPKTAAEFFAAHAAIKDPKEAAEFYAAHEGKFFK